MSNELETGCLGKGNPTPADVQKSQAISLKRIADSLELIAQSERLHDSIFNAISAALHQNRTNQ